MGVGGKGVDVGEGVKVGVRVGVRVAVEAGGGAVSVALGDGALAIGVGVWIAIAFRISRGVGVESSDVLLKANQRVAPEPKAIKIVPRQSPLNRIVPRAKIILYRFCFNLITSFKIYSGLYYMGLTAPIHNVETSRLNGFKTLKYCWHNHRQRVIIERDVPLANHMMAQIQEKSGFGA